MLPRKQKGEPSFYDHKASKKVGGRGDPMAPIRINRGRGILQILLNS